MRETLIITDLTKMGGDRVCIAGIGPSSQCIRPVLPRGVQRQHLFKRTWKNLLPFYRKRALLVYPRAKIRFDSHPVSIQPPHIEDMGFDPHSITHQGSCTDAAWETVLQAGSFRSVQDVYDGLLQERRWVAPGANTRSLGTVRQVQIREVRLGVWGSERDYRLCFIDEAGRRYDDVSISDLAFRAFSDTEIDRLVFYAEASRRITRLLAGVDRVYLRLGLARPWAPSNGSFGLRCWMQVTGIHTFPDYLAGLSLEKLLAEA